MEEQMTLKLPSLMVGQILEALYARLEAWEYTEEFLNSGKVDQRYLIEKC
jgi:hypothetical protein